MKTYSARVQDVSRKWYLVDAKDQILGRMATQIAKILMGKNKPDFDRHIDMADHIVVINAAAVKVTGRKENQKLYHYHSGYPGGMKVLPLSYVRQSHPDRLISHAVSGMLPKNKLQDRLLTHLHIYPGAEHPYTSQFK